jgi:hypothetical protein
MRLMSVILLEISSQQLELQAQIAGVTAVVRDLRESRSIDALATVPMLDKELLRLAEFNKRISQRIQRASR